MAWRGIVGLFGRHSLSCLAISAVEWWGPRLDRQTVCDFAQMGLMKWMAHQKVPLHTLVTLTLCRISTFVLANSKQDNECIFIRDTMLSPESIRDAISPTVVRTVP